MTVRILVVDDETDVEMLFRQQFPRELRDQRFKMDFAFSANDALAFLAATPDTDDLILILSDINMPGMTGIELLPKIKAARPTLPAKGLPGLFGYFPPAIQNKALDLMCGQGLIAGRDG